MLGMAKADFKAVEKLASAVYSAYLLSYERSKLRRFMLGYIQRSFKRRGPKISVRCEEKTLENAHVIVRIGTVEPAEEGDAVKRLPFGFVEGPSGRVKSSIVVPIDQFAHRFNSVLTRS